MSKYLEILKGIMPNIESLQVNGMALYEVEVHNFVNANILLKDSELIHKVLVISANQFKRTTGLTVKEKIQIDSLNAIRYFKGKLPKNFVINSYKTFDELVANVETCFDKPFYYALTQALNGSDNFSVRGINKFASQLYEGNYRYISEDNEPPLTYTIDTLHGICFMVSECKVIPISEFIDYLRLNQDCTDKAYYGEIADYISSKMEIYTHNDNTQND